MCWVRRTGNELALFACMCVGKVEAGSTTNWEPLAATCTLFLLYLQLFVCHKAPH